MDLIQNCLSIKQQWEFPVSVGVYALLELN